MIFNSYTKKSLRVPALWDEATQNVWQITSSRWLGTRDDKTKKSAPFDALCGEQMR
jgi:hypothetical protein